VGTFHSGKQGELEDITEHIESKLSRVNRKWLAHMVELKTPWEPIWDPTKNLACGYQKAITPSFRTHEGEIAQLKRRLEKLKRSQRWSDFDNSHIRRSSQMSFTNEDEFKPPNFDNTNV
jgi:hypothetical protein